MRFVPGHALLVLLAASTPAGCGSSQSPTDSAMADAAPDTRGTEGGPTDSSTPEASADAASDTAAVDAERVDAAHMGPWKMMPFGDSITGATCYPQLLSQELISKGHTNFTFVGTITDSASCNGAPNVQTEGHSGFLVSCFDPSNTVGICGDQMHGTPAQLDTWSMEKPDVVVFEMGTNDCWNAVPANTLLSEFTLVLTKFRAQNPSVIFFVAQITPLNPSGCSMCESLVESLNAAIPGWATSNSTGASPIFVVDVWSKFMASTYLPNSTYTSDGVHPNVAGAQLLADAWYAGLTAQGIP